MLTVKLKCPDHPGYDPRRQGYAGINGGGACYWCRQIWALGAAADLISGQIRDELKAREKRKGTA